MTIILATGGSGGHIIPAMRVAHELMSNGHDIVFFGSFSRNRDLLAKSGFNCIDINVRGFTKSLKGAIGAAWLMAGAVIKSISLVKGINPQAVVGFGGYGSVPAILAAALLRRPILIHEQNVMPGKANKFVARFARTIALSFEESKQYFPNTKTVITGCPCHTPDNSLDIAKTLKAFNLDAGKKTILVAGGSQGSSRINKVFTEAAKALQGRIDFQVIHLAGKKDVEGLRKKYNEMGIPFALYDFLDKMKEAYAVSDLVIARSGAVTVSEIAGFGLPSIMIPYPHAQGHQKANAALLVKAGLSKMIDDEQLTAENLSQEILDLTSSAVKSDGMIERLKGVYRANAAQNICKEVEALLNV